MYSRRKFGPRPGSVARTLGVQSRANRQVTTLSAEPEPRKTMEILHFTFVAPVSHKVTTLASSFPPSYRHGHYADTAVRVWTTIVRVWTLLMSECVCYVCVCACGSVHFLCAGTRKSFVSYVLCVGTDRYQVCKHL